MAGVLGTLLVDGFWNGAARIARLHPRARPERHGVERVANVPYGGDARVREHHLDVWRPARRDGPLPVVLYVHGGGFRILSKDTHWVMALSFARRGFVVFNVDYRLARGPETRFPAPLEDVCTAYAWVVANAAGHGGDPSRLVLAGESAGANLVTSASIAATYERPEPFAKRVFDTGVVPRAVLAACGIHQVSDTARLARRKPRMSKFVVERLSEVERSYLGDGPWTCATDLADPVCFFERGEHPSRPLPPFFLPVGTKDPLLPDTRRLGAALRALGAVAEDRYYRGGVHAFHAFATSALARACWADTFAFLDRTLP